ncbi:MAG: glutamyl-tRNA reductase [Candidatus Hydrogenedentota bacterium]
MGVVVVGLSHHTSPLELRERLHFPPESIPSALLELQNRLNGGAAVILSTCNRVEVYAHHDKDAAALCEDIRAFITEWHGVPGEEFADSFYEYKGPEAVGHLFRVTASLDSLVVGEAQILGQVHEAFMLAQSQQTHDKVLSAMFQRAFRVAKQVRTETKIGAGKVSVASVAVDLAVSIFMDLEDKTVMIVGSGKMGETTLKSLLACGVGRILLANRSAEKAISLAESLGGEAVAFEALDDTLHRADIVITSTAATAPILTPAHFQRALKKRGNAPMFVIDIAVPRNVAPQVNDLDNVYLYDGDALQQVANENLEARREEIDQCLKMVDEGVEKFVQWMRSLAAEPAILSISEELHGIRERELEKLLTAHPDLTKEHQEAITEMTRRLVNTILQRPMTQLKREVVTEDPSFVLQLVRRIFGLKET